MIGMLSRDLSSPCSCPGRRTLPTTRREMLAASAGGFGLVALAGLFGENVVAGPQANRVSLPKPHFAPKAKNVIFLFMDGGVSHVDSFDPKPKLT